MRRPLPGSLKRIFILLFASSSLALAGVTVNVTPVFTTNGIAARDVAIWQSQDGNTSLLFVSDKGRDAIEVHDPVTNTFLYRLGSSGPNPGQFDRPFGLAVGYSVPTATTTEDVLFVVERDNSRVSMFSLPDTSLLGTFGEDRMDTPRGIDLHWDGNQPQAWVTEIGGTDDSVFVYNILPNGAGLTGQYNFGFRVPGLVEFLAVDAANQRVLVSDEINLRVSVLDLSGNLLQTFGSGRFTGTPKGITIYDEGNGRGLIFVADKSSIAGRFEVFDRQNFDTLGVMIGTTKNTDGIEIFQGTLPNLPSGAFLATDDDRRVHAYELSAILASFNLNRQPTLTPVSDQTMNEGDTLALNIGATDLDGDLLAIAASNLPAFSNLVDHGNGTATLTLTPSFVDAGSYPGIRITVTDDGSPALSDSITFALTVSEVEIPPQIAAIGDTAMNEGEVLAIPINAVSPGGNGLSLSGNNLPNFASLNDNGNGSGTLLLSPGFQDANNYIGLEIIATENTATALKDTATFSLAVNNANGAPQLQVIADQTMNENDTLRLTLSASDPDGNNLALFGNNLPIFATFVDSGNGQGSLAFATGFDDGGFFSGIEIIVIDDGIPARSDTIMFALTVNQVNRAPVVTAVTNQQMNEGDTLALAISASDPDGDILTLNGSNLPAFGNLVDHGNGTATWTLTPSFLDAAVYTGIRIRVTDNGAPVLSDSTTFSLTVNDLDVAPQLAAIGDTAVNEGGNLAIAINATSLDGHSLSLSGNNLPVFASLSDNGNGTGTLLLAPGFQHGGSYTGLEIIATENTTNSLADTTRFDLTVTEANAAPQLVAIPAQVMNEGQVLSLKLSATDPDNNALALFGNNLPAFATFVDSGNGQGTLAFAPGFTDDGTFPGIEIIVIDNGSPTRSDTAVFVLTVNPVNRAPQVAAIANQIINEGDTLTVAISAVDPDNDPVTLTATNLPPFAAFTDSGNGGGQLVFTPSFTDSGSYPDLRIVASDTGAFARSDTASFTLAVNQVDRLPAAPTNLIAAVNGNDKIDLTWADNDSIELGFLIERRQGNQPFAQIDSVGSNVTAFTDSLLQASTTYTYRVRAASIDGPTAYSNEAVASTGAAALQSPTVNLALNRPVTALDTHPDYTPGDAVDGDEVNHWRSGAITGDPTNWLQVDLQGQQTVGRVVIKWRGTFHATSHLIQVSPNGSDWTTVDSTNAGTGGTEMRLFVETAARFVRLLMTANSNSSYKIGELEIYSGDLAVRITPVGDQTMNEGDTLTIALAADDPLGNNLSFSGSNLPPFAAIFDNGDGTGALRFTPSFTAAAVYNNLQIIATNDAVPSVSDTTTFALTVNDFNTAPKLTPISAQIVNEGNTLTVPVSALDLQGEAISLATFNMPLFAVFTDSGGGKGQLVFFPGFDDAGTYNNILVIATDNAPVPKSDTAAFNLTVHPANAAPVFTAIANQVMNEGDTLRVTLSASDPDSNGLALFGNNLPVFATLADSGNGQGTLILAPGFDDAGAFPNLEIIVTDNGSPALSDTATLMLTVNHVNRAPQVTAITHQNVSEGDTLAVTVNASDPDNDPVTLTALSLPPFATFIDSGNGSGLIVFIPSFADSGSYPNLRVVATDTATVALADTAAFTLTVNQIDVPPEVPGNLIASANGNDKIDLIWADNDTSETGFLIERRQGSQPFAQIDSVGSNVSAFTDSLLQVSTTYTYRVRTVSTEGQSPYSNESGATTAAAEFQHPTVNLALNRPAMALSTHPDYNPEAATDGDEANHWRSGAINGDPSNWLQVDLQSQQTVGRVVIRWRGAFHATGHRIQVSHNGNDWITVDSTNAGTGGNETRLFAETAVRFLRLVMTANSNSSYKIGELEVYSGDIAVRVTPVSDQTMNEGDTLTVALAAIDPLGNNLSISGANLPAFASLSDSGNGNGILRLTPGFTAAASYTGLQIIATNDAVPPVSDTTTFALTVNDHNTPPQLTPISAQNVNEGDTLIVLVSAVDPQGDAISLAAFNKPLFSAFTDSGNGKGRLAFFPGFAEAGVYAGVQVVAKDNATPVLSDTLSFDLTVTNILNPPTGPSNLTATADGSDRITLMWDDNASNETGFIIERSLGDQSSSLMAGSKLNMVTNQTFAVVDSSGANTTSYTDSLLLAGTSYVYRVRAFNNEGNSGYSNEDTAATGLASIAPSTQNLALGRPANASSSNGDNLPAEAFDADIVSHWRSANADSEPEQWLVVDLQQQYFLGKAIIQWRGTFHATAHQLQVSHNNSDWTTIVNTSSSNGGTETLAFKQVTGRWVRLLMMANNNTSYKIGELEIYAPAFVDTGGAPPPPSNLTAFATSDTAVVLQWNDNASNEDSMRVERRELSGTFAPIAVLPTNSTSYVDRNATANTTYLYRVAASNNNGNSIYSNEATAKTGSATAAGASVNLALGQPATASHFRNGNPPADAVDDNVVTHWRSLNVVGAPAAWLQVDLMAPEIVGKVVIEWRGNFYATLYHLLASFNGSDWDTLLTVAGAGGTEEHNFPQRRLRFLRLAMAANNDATYKIGELAIYSGGKLDAPPSAPSDLIANAVSISQIDLSWIDNSANEDGFIIQRRISGGGSFATIDSVSNDVTSYSDLGLSEAITYDYRVRAFNSQGDSDFSNETPATTGSSTPADPSVNLALGASMSATSSHSDYPPANAVDNLGDSHWRSLSLGSDPVQTLTADLLLPQTIGRVVINWRGSFFATSYQIQTSSDNSNWTTVVTNNSGTGGAEEHTFAPSLVRYMRLVMNVNNGTTYKIGELEVYSGALPKAIADLSSFAEVPESFALRQNYPNPFNPSTAIDLALPQDGHVILRVYTHSGQYVRTLINEERRAGQYTVRWNGNGRGGELMAAGIYLYRLIVRDAQGTVVYRKTNRMTLLK